MPLCPKMIHTICDRVCLKVSAPCPFKRGLFCSMRRGGNRANKWRSPAGVPLVLHSVLVLCRWLRRVRSPTILATGLHLAALSQGTVWILSGTLARSPLTGIIYLKRETKQGGMLSCTQCTDSVQCEKAIVENLNQSFFAAGQSFQIAFGWLEKTETDESTGLEAGYADRGGRFVNKKNHHPLRILLLSWHKKSNDSFLRHFSEVAMWSRRKSSIIKLLDFPLGLSNWIFF